MIDIYRLLEIYWKNNERFSAAKKYFWYLNALIPENIDQQPNGTAADKVSETNKRNPKKNGAYHKIAIDTNRNKQWKQ